MWEKLGENTIQNIRTKEIYTYDKVFDHTSNTFDIFNSQIRQMVLTALSGINVTIFAYG